MVRLNRVFQWPQLKKFLVAVGSSLELLGDSKIVSIPKRPSLKWNALRKAQDDSLMTHGTSADPKSKQVNGASRPVPVDVRQDFLGADGEAGSSVFLSTNPVYSYPEAPYFPIRVRNQKRILDTYLQEALRVPAKPDTPPDVAMFSAKLAKKDSLVVQYKSYVKSRDRAKAHHDGTGSVEYINTGPDPGVDLQLLIPKLSTDGKIVSVVEDFVPPETRTVDEMVQAALDKKLERPPTPRLDFDEEEEDVKEKSQPDSGRKTADGNELTGSEPATPQDQQDKGAKGLMNATKSNIRVTKDPPEAGVKPPAIIPESVPADENRSSFQPARKSQTERIAGSAEHTNSSIENGEPLFNLPVSESEHSGEQGDSSATKLNEEGVQQLMLPVPQPSANLASEDSMARHQKQTGVRFAPPGPADYHTYDQVELEGSVKFLRAADDFELIENMEKNICETRALTDKLQAITFRYDSETYAMFGPTLAPEGQKVQHELDPLALGKKIVDFNRRKQTGTQLLAVSKDKSLAVGTVPPHLRISKGAHVRHNALADAENTLLPPTNWKSVGKTVHPRSEKSRRRVSISDKERHTWKSFRRIAYPLPENLIDR